MQVMGSGGFCFGFATSAALIQRDQFAELYVKRPLLYGVPFMKAAFTKALAPVLGFC